MKPIVKLGASEASQSQSPRVGVSIALALAMLCGAPLAAANAEEAISTPRHTVAQQAGALALHLCTGVFSSEMSRELIDRTAPKSPVPLTTTIDEVNKRVSVSYSASMPPRLAVWKPVTGCTQLPIGADATLADALPRLPAATAAPMLDSRQWPMGDVNATARLPAERSAAVERVIDEAFKGREGVYRGNTWGVVIIKDGKIVGERYSPGYGLHVAARTNSMCKSLGSTLVGVGVSKGLLDVKTKAPLREWRRPGDPRGQISLENLLHMASGLYTEGGGDPQSELYQSGAAAAEISALNLVDSRPGERYVYAGSDTILAVRALRQAIDDDEVFRLFPYSELLWKIGMTRTIAETDWNDDILASGQCWSTVRDFARFGMLYLADGVWNGERLLAPGWATYVSTPAPAQPQPDPTGQWRPGEPVPNGARYGAQFWIYGGIDGLPALAYSPRGALGQFAMIVPEKKVVVVRRGLDVGPAFRIAKFSADIITALEGR